MRISICLESLARIETRPALRFRTADAMRVSLACSKREGRSCEAAFLVMVQVSANVDRAHAHPPHDYRQRDDRDQYHQADGQNGAGKQKPFIWRNVHEGRHTHV